MEPKFALYSWPHEPRCRRTKHCIFEFTFLAINGLTVIIGYVERRTILLSWYQCSSIAVSVLDFWVHVPRNSWSTHSIFEFIFLAINVLILIINCVKWLTILLTSCSQWLLLRISLLWIVIALTAWNHLKPPCFEFIFLAIIASILVIGYQLEPRGFGSVVLSSRAQWDAIHSVRNRYIGRWGWLLW